MSQAPFEDTAGARERALCALAERVQALQVEHATNAAQLVQALEKSNAALCDAVHERAEHAAMCAATFADLQKSYKDLFDKVVPRVASRYGIVSQTTQENTDGYRELNVCLNKLETAHGSARQNGARADCTIEAIMHDAMQLRAKHAATSAAILADLAEIEQAIREKLGLCATVTSGASQST